MTETLSCALSPDGTEIGYASSGDGPPLLLVHGVMGSRASWQRLLPHLETDFTVHAMDRRGRGLSGDNADYAMEQEYEDVAAVVDSIALEAGTAVNVFAYSFGGHCALGAASLSTSFAGLALYEGWPLRDPGLYAPPAGFLARARQLLSENDREGVIVAMFRDVVGARDEPLESLRQRPYWSDRVAIAHTVVREQEALASSYLNREQATAVTIPVLLLAGSESGGWLAAIDEVASVLPNATFRLLEGQGHAAHMTAADLVASELRAFFLHDE